MTDRLLRAIECRHVKILGHPTGRVLLHADFDALARQYLPTLAEAGRIAEEEVREEIVNFLST